MPQVLAVVVLAVLAPVERSSNALWLNCEATFSWYDIKKPARLN